MVQSAMGRIRDGSFGQCLSCGKEIDAKRLHAVPWTRYSIQCQEGLRAVSLEAVTRPACPSSVKQQPLASQQMTRPFGDQKTGCQYPLFDRGTLLGSPIRFVPQRFKSCLRVPLAVGLKRQGKSFVEVTDIRSWIKQLGGPSCVLFSRLLPVQDDALSFSPTGRPAVALCRPLYVCLPWQ